MITTHIKPGVRKPRVLAVFSFRYDEHLVLGLIANITPLVDGWVAYDDRGGAGLFSDESHRRAELLDTARRVGAHWALAVDPDERFESALAAEIDRLTSTYDARAYTFAVREMYSPDQYRVDGIWGQKRDARLLSIVEGVSKPAGALHTPWAAFTPGARLHYTDFNLYHLKMITPERRKARAALYAHLDPDKRMQPIGYHYLADDAGAVLERIAPGREYEPPHQEDGSLWMRAVPEGPVRG